ncbi:MAG: FAD-binding oxidoreductase [Thermoleophilia bacterium]|nr:FAD-binding oxidoreductase [Thermoleophilia bacterium]
MRPAEIVGEENVATSVVRPGNVAELQAVVRWANEEGVPLVPMSSGPPHCHGGTVPGTEGAVIVDLRRMNKILRVDAANRVAIVEPGVTFADLQAELARSGLSAYMPLLPRSAKSVLASALERDPIVMPAAHFDSTDPMLCTEIVLGTGDRMRTGEAAGPDSLEEQWEIGKAQISPFGPTQMDMQRLVSGAQGTIGVVSWMSLKCRFLSELTRSYFIPSAGLEPLIDLCYQLTRIRFSGNIFIVNGLDLAALLRRMPEEISALRDELPPWVMFVSCEGYGPLPEEKVDYLEADLRELAQSRGLHPEADIAGASADGLSRLLVMPSPDPHWKLRFGGGCSDLFFLTTQGKTPQFAGVMREEAAKQGFPWEDIGVYIQPVVQGTGCHCEFDLFHDPADSAASRTAGDLARAAADALEAEGAFFSRPYGLWKDVAYRRSPDTAELQKKIKKVFDPNGILNPGKLCF